MRAAWLVAAFPLLLGLASAVLAAEPDGSSLPPLPGSDVTTQACTHCHGSEVIARRRLNPDQWAKMVQLMIRFGAKVNDDEKREIIDYLSRAFPPEHAPADGGKPE